MASSSKNTYKLESTLKMLYDNIQLTDIPEHAPYIRTYYQPKESHALTDAGYRAYHDFIREALAYNNIGQYWSQQAILEKVETLILDLVRHKNTNGNTSPDFKSIVSNWLEGIRFDFVEKDCYLPATGLFVEQPLQIGDITFLPFETEAGIYSKHLPNVSKRLPPHKTCLVHTTAKAEWIKSTEILREKAEQSLNILRFISSLVWWQQPVSHIYLAGKQPHRVSYSLVIEADGSTGRRSHEEFSPVPLKIDNKFIELANHFGLSYIQSLINGTPSPLEQDFLAAIQWYGNAYQETEPLFSFVKFYIAIETVLKKDRESAKSVLPRRISVLLEPHIKERQRKLENNFKNFVDERNSVFHEGKTNSYTSEYLKSSALILSRQILHQLRLRIKSEGFKNKDDLEKWSQEQYKKYLQ